MNLNIFKTFILSVALVTVVFLGVHGLVVRADGLTAENMAAITNLLRSFNIDEATIDVVATTLRNRTTSNVQQTTAYVCPNIPANLRKGSTGTMVTALQKYLIAKGYLAEGNDTGSFGSLTAQAVIKLQRARGIDNSSDFAYGVVGPKTRQAIANCNNQAGDNTTTQITATNAQTQTTQTNTPNTNTTQNTTQTSNTGNTATTGGGVTLPAGPAISFSASPLDISYGQSSVLTWSSPNAVSCVSDQFPTGNATSGTYSVASQISPTLSFSQRGFSLTCTDKNGNINRAALMIADHGQGTGVVNGPTTGVISFIPSFTVGLVTDKNWPIKVGSTFSVQWVTASMSSCNVSIPSGLTVVPIVVPGGSTYPGVLGNEFNGIEDFRASTAGNYTFTLTCKGTDGTNQTATAIAVIQ